MPAVIVLDVGEDIVGIYVVDDAKYTPYRGASRQEAIALIQRARYVISYNGSRYDLPQLAKLVGLRDGATLPIDGEHVDMQEVCWPDILGSSLASTYARLIGDCPAFPETHEGSNERDVHMTYELWRLWQSGKLKDIHGRFISPHAT